MKRYDSYKDSGVKWLGKIPSHWALMPGFAIFKENKNKNTDLLEKTVLSLSYGKIILKKDIDEGLVPADYKGYQIVHPGYIIIRCTDLQNDKVSLRTGLVKDEGIITGAYLGLIVDENYNSSYIHYFLHTWDITKEIYRHGSGLRQSLSWLDFRRLPVLLPTIEEQEEIVLYLDSATSKIDEAIAQQQKMIDLLNERKQIIINNAVTKGLDPNVKMKPSGIDWIGDIPEHWEVKKVKTMISIQRGHDLTSEKFIYGNIPVYGSGGLMGYHNMITSKAPSIIVGRSGSVGKLQYITEDFWAHNTTIYMTDNRGNCTKYLYYVLSSIDLKALATQTAVPTLDRKNVLSYNYPFTNNIEEQVEIARYLDDITNKISDVIANCYKQISLLQERKQIIINDVVTGKVKVV